MTFFISERSQKNSGDCWERGEKFLEKVFYFLREFLYKK